MRPIAVKNFILKHQDMYSEILNKEQKELLPLAYHQDIDYSEEIEYFPGYAVDKEEIKTFLIHNALNTF